MRSIVSVNLGALEQVNALRSLNPSSSFFLFLLLGKTDQGRERYAAGREGERSMFTVESQLVYIARLRISLHYNLLDALGSL